MIPKIWQKKVKKCSQCGKKPIGSTWQRIYTDDIGGRIICPKCYKTFVHEAYGVSRYMMWKWLVEGWNRKN